MMEFVTLAWIGTDVSITCAIHGHCVQDLRPRRVYLLTRTACVDCHLYGPHSCVVLTADERSKLTSAEAHFPVMTKVQGALWYLQARLKPLYV
jgi:hypothetical protein